MDTDSKGGGKEGEEGNMEGGVRSHLMLMNASSPPWISSFSNVSLISSPRFSLLRWLYSIPSPLFTAGI